MKSTKGKKNIRKKMAVKPPANAQRKILNRSSIPIYLSIGALAIFVLYGFYLNLKTSSIELGAYDPENLFNDVSQITIQHEFISWESYDTSTISDILDSTRSKSRSLLLTIEPWPHEYSDDGIKNLFPDILSGDYDALLSGICTSVRTADFPVWIRWGHEMELNQRRYPWSQDNPNGYVEAYRYVASKCAALAPNALFVWSPAGDAGSQLYWPGDDYVNFIGLSVFSYKDFEIEKIGREFSFQDILKGKYRNIKKYNKPVIITELGIAADPDEQKVWMSRALSDLHEFPLVRALIYFNAPDHVGTWGFDFPTPDWRINKETINKLKII